MDGIITRSSAVKPKLVVGYYECLLCGTEISVPQLSNKINWPKFCNNGKCKAKVRGDFLLITKKSKFIDWQTILVQERPETLPPGRMPQNIKMILKHDLVDTIKAGDRIMLTGIYRSVLKKSLNDMTSTLFDSYIEVNYVETEGQNAETIKLTRKELIEIKKIAKEPEIQKRIAHSIAPTIYGHEEVKMACALAMFGGVRTEMPDNTYRRGIIHILIIGDPGLGKTVEKNSLIYIIKNEKMFCKPIGIFIDNIMEKNKYYIKKEGDSEILSLKNKKIYTTTINLDTLKNEKTKIEEVSRHKIDKLIKITMMSGRSIICTLDHSFSTLVNGKLKILLGSELNTTDIHLPILRNITIKNPRKEYVEIIKYFPNELFKRVSSKKIIKNIINRNTYFPEKLYFDNMFGRIVGIYIAEGSIVGMSVMISNTENDILNTIKKDIKTLFGNYNISKYNEKEISIQFNQKNIAWYLGKFFGKGAGNKKFPHIFLNTPILFRRAVLGAYFSGDGTVGKNGEISATTKSKELAYNMCDLLSTLGIFARIRKKIIRSGDYKGNKYYGIIISGNEVLNFHRQIKFLQSRKQNMLNALVKKLYNRKRYQSLDMIPNFGDILQRICEDLELKSIRETWERSFISELRGKKQRQYTGRKYMQKIVTKFEELYSEKNKPYSEDLIWLKKLAYSDIYWDKIKTIKKIQLKEPEYGYDIGTESGHFVVANGNIITHNSKIGESIKGIAPRSLWTTGSGASKVGLTATVIQVDGEWMLEAGALVLANDGILIIDEFDKMKKDDQGGLHEAMAQLSISIAKAGIVSTLLARTAIIAVANPYFGRYSDSESVSKNIRIPPALISRFDLIFVLKDKPDEERDKHIAEYILKKKCNENCVDHNLLKKYVMYAKKKCFPKLTDNVNKKIEEFYLDLRSNYNSENAIISMVPRQLEALKRLTEAHAKMGLKKTATEEDVEAIIPLFKRYLFDTGYDEETGTINADKLLSGNTMSILSKMDLLNMRLEEIFTDNNHDALDKKSVIDLLELESELDIKFIEKQIVGLLSDGTLYSPKIGHIKMTKKK